MNIPLALCGLAIWAAGTLVLRVAGQNLLHPGNWAGILILFAVSFPLMGWLVRRLCRRFHLPREQWPAGAISVALPTFCWIRFRAHFSQQSFQTSRQNPLVCSGGGCCAAAPARWWALSFPNPRQRAGYEYYERSGRRPAGG